MFGQHHSSNKEATWKNHQHREPGGLVVKEPVGTRKVMEITYRKAEEEQWRAKKERREGQNRWASEQVEMGTPEEEKEAPSRTQWREYCRKEMAPKTADRTHDNPAIVPTCPPHPVGDTRRANAGEEKTGGKWGRLIQQWVAEVGKEDERRGRTGHMN